MEWYPFPPFSLLNMRAEFRGFQIRQRGAWNSDLDAFVIHIKMALTLACLSSEGQSISSSSKHPFRKLAVSELRSIFEFHLRLLFNQSKISIILSYFPSPKGFVNLKKFCRIKCFSSDFAPKALSTRQFSFAVNQELQGGLKVRGSEINFVI